MKKSSLQGLYMQIYAFQMRKDVALDRGKPYLHAMFLSKILGKLAPIIP